MADGWFHLINPLYSASGFGVGLLVGLTGVGGGSLMTPLLVLLFGIHPARAVGTDLLYAAITKSGGTLVHSLNKAVDWRVTGRLALGSVPATALTIFGLSTLDAHDGGVSGLVSSTLGVALILTALTLVFRRFILESFARRVGELSPTVTRNLTIATGAILGVLVSLSSVGAGALGVTALLMLYPRLPVVRIVGSDIAHAVPLTFCAGIGHWMLGDVDGILLLSLILGSLPGIAIGSHLASRIPEKILRIVLASTLVVVGGRLIG